MDLILVLDRETRSKLRDEVQDQGQVACGETCDSCEVTTARKVQGRRLTMALRHRM